MATPTAVKNRLKRMFSSQHYINNNAISQDVASLFIPRRSNIQSDKSTGDTAGWYDHILDPAPIEVARTLAQGQYDLLFTGDWFETAAPFDDGKQNDKIDKAYAKVGERMRETIDASNFKLEIQEFLADRSTVHTAVILVEDDEDETIFTRAIEPGKYAIEENHKKRVDVLGRKIPLTARQIKQKFNKETDTIPDKVQQALDQDKPDTLFEVQQLIEKRFDFEPGSDDPKLMPWASTYIFKTDIIREGGYMEQPFMVSRFDRWGDSPYGTGPAHIELPRARSLQKMAQALIALGDRLTNPGVFISDKQEDDVSPFGTTIVSREDNAAQLPREWNTTARYDVTGDMLDREIKQMEDIFFVPLFKLLINDTEREKTAFETQKMLEEQVGRAAPTFSRLDVEVIVLFLQRVFNQMLRAGKFDDLMDDLTVFAGGVEGIAEPSINFTSKLAQAMKAVRSNTVIQFLNSLGFVFELKPDVLENTDWDKTYHRMWKDAGNPLDELIPVEQVKEDREQRQAAEQAALTAQAAEQAGKANQALNG